MFLIVINVIAKHGTWHGSQSIDDLSMRHFKQCFFWNYCSLYIARSVANFEGTTTMEQCRVFYGIRQYIADLKDTKWANSIMLEGLPNLTSSYSFVYRL